VVALSLQYWDGKVIRVEFLSLIQGDRLTAQKLATVIWVALGEWGLQPEHNLVGVGCNSSGRLVATFNATCNLLAARAKPLLGFGCHPHLSLVSAIASALPLGAVTPTLSMLSQLAALSLFFMANPRRVGVLERQAVLLRGKNPPLSDLADILQTSDGQPVLSLTRLAAFVSVYDIVVAALRELADGGQFAPLVAFEARGILNAITTLDTIVAVNFMLAVARQVQMLVAELDSRVHHGYFGSTAASGRASEEEVDDDGDDDDDDDNNDDADNDKGDEDEQVAGLRLPAKTDCAPTVKDSGSPAFAATAGASVAGADCGNPTSFGCVFSPESGRSDTSCEDIAETMAADDHTASVVPIESVASESAPLMPGALPKATSSSVLASASTVPVRSTATTTSNSSSSTSSNGAFPLNDHIYQSSVDCAKQVSA
jgi:hypothetical protein